MSEKSRWNEVVEKMDKPPVKLGQYVSYWFGHTPRRALFNLSYYKFAAKMVGKNKRVLEVGCNEGLGTWVLAVECGYAKGLDLDERAIQVAQSNWQDPRIDFEATDFLKYEQGEFDAVVTFDTIEHIFSDNIDQWWSKMTSSLKHDGIAVVTTPNLNSQVYASEVAKIGHVNVYTAERLEAEMRRYFSHVFMFAANDEVVHTGFMPMAHSLVAVGCKKKV